jgi:azurin
MKTITRTLSIALAVVAVASCDNKSSGGNQTPPPTSTSTPATTPTASAAPAPTKAPDPPEELKIGSVGNEMKFDKDKLTVTAGAQVHLVLKNNATMDTMPHNWVLVKVGTEAKVALDGLTNAADAGYVVPGPDVLANSPMAAPGKTAEITFTAPPVGKYPYICTTPGHYLMMKGTLISEAP